MPRALWPLVRGRPVIHVTLPLAQGSQELSRILLADTGAGAVNSGFELLLEESDCKLCGGIPLPGVMLGGAYSGSYPLYLIQVRILHLGFHRAVPAVGVPSGPPGIGGIACFPFLNRFAYGNFADSGQFGLET